MSNYNTFAFAPANGLRDRGVYETRPASEDRTREILSDMPEQLKTFLNNDLIAKLETEHALLRSLNGATQIGAGPLATGYPENVQDAMEQLHAEMQDIVLGTVSDDSITSEKLAPAVRAQIGTTAGVSEETAQYAIFPESMTAENRAAFEADAAKMALYYASRLYKALPVAGTYTGNGTYDSDTGAYTNPTRTITLGFTPSAVLVLQRGCLTFTSTQLDPSTPSAYAIYGGLAVAGSPVSGSCVKIVEGGFEVVFHVSAGTWSSNYATNESGKAYNYIAWR